MLGLIELHDFANQLRYDEKKIVFWHQFGMNLRTGGRVLNFDSAVCSLVNHLNKDRDALVYFQHLEGENEVSIALGDDNGPELDMSFLDDVILSEPEYSSSENSDSDDSDALVDSEYDMEEDDKLYEKYVDPSVEFNPFQQTGEKMKNKFVSEEVYASLEAELKEVANSSDEFDSIQGSDEEDMPNYPKFNPVTEARKPDLKLGLIFTSKKEAKETITTHCIKRGVDFRVVHNDKKRLQILCKNEGCEWYVWVSPMQNDKCWQIAYNPEHTKCFWNWKNSSIKSNWVGKHYMKKFKNNPNLKAGDFRTDVCNKLKANISTQQTYIARKKAIELINGTAKEQFSRIRDYCHELLRTNPGSSVVLKLIESGVEGSSPQFLRLYICFAACKEGFKACRKVVGVDGCFLKGPHGGQLLTAVGIDPNNNMVPIAYAVVESETRNAWEWFLTLLDNDIGFDDQYAWTFMSDKQKGLIPAFENLLPDASNRFCVQHLHSNMKKDGFLGLAVKNALWAAARATRYEVFTAKMQEMKDLDEKTHDWLATKNPSQWSRAYFNPLPKCDILTNNICENFNSLILRARDKPIITMLETIRNILMTRLQVNRDAAMKWDDIICPRIMLALKKNMMLAAERTPMKSDDWHFQIFGPLDQHNVDVSQKSCTCRRWDLTGIPCKHAISAIWYRDKDPVSYVHDHYSVDAYKRAYANPILGIISSDLWPKCDLPKPLPLTYDKKAGRPKKLRRRGPNEPPTKPSNPHRIKKKNQRTLKCRKCGVSGHNSRTCSKNINATFASPSELDPEQSTEHVEPEEMPNGDSQSFTPACNTQASRDSPLQSNIGAQPKKNKLPVRRSSHASSKAQTDCSGSSTNPSQGSKALPEMGNSGGSKKRKNADHRTNVVQSSNINSPVIVKGGVNYITMSNFGTYMANSGPSQGTTSKGNTKGKSSENDNGDKPKSG